MRTYINKETNEEVLAKMVKLGNLNTYPIYEKESFELIEILVKEEFKAKYIKKSIHQNSIL